MALTRFASLLLAACAVAHGQTVSIGIKAGARLTGDLEGSGDSESKRYAVGPTVEFALPWRFAVKVDALYRPVGYRTYQSDILGSSSFTRGRANSWEFPLLAKYRLPKEMFVSGGWALRTLRFSRHAVGEWVDYFGNRTPIDIRETGSRELSHGAVIGAGIEFGRHRLRLAPEFRYTHWNNRPLDIFGRRGYYLQSTQNQLEILVGLRWR